MAKVIQRASREFASAQYALGAANVLGAPVPTTVPTLGAKVCSFVCAKLSSFWGWSFCSSALATWLVGLVGFLVIGEVVIRIVS